MSRQAFDTEAMLQRVCAVCGQSNNNWQGHHVVYEQELRRRGLPIYDARNSLRTCGPGDGCRPCGKSNCHARHHSRMRVIKTSELTDWNITYAFEVLGDYAYDYLCRYYDNTDRDPRLELASGATVGVP